MKIFENVSLKDYNTFNIDVKADFFVSVSTIEELKYCLSTKPEQNKIIIGGGSNILFTKPFKGLVIHLNLKGINIISKNNNQAIVNAAAGENWHNFVSWTLSEDLGGLENLSYIPGNVGTAPIQNIGAYGVEVSQFISKVRFYDFIDKQIKVFNNSECNFSYRKSIFQKMDILILSVNFIFTLNKLFTNYESIENYLNYNNIDLKDLTPKKLAKYIQEIRLSKLPDYKKLPNVGSFFKNPILDKNEYRLIHAKNKKLISWDYNRDLVKVGAARLIELIKDKLPKNLEVDIYDNHALVLINKKNANQEDVINFSSLIKNEVFKHFKIDLEIEPIIIKS